MRRLVLAGALLAVGIPAPARAMVTMQVNAVSDRGYISMFVVTSPELPDVTINERVDGELRELLRPRMQFVAGTADYGDVNYGEGPRIMRWKCSRRERVLVAVARAADGRSERERYSVKTPSCANRLSLRVAPGRATVTDFWGVGDVQATLCAARCHTVRLSRGQKSAHRRLAIDRGDRVLLRTRYQRVVQEVGSKPRGGPSVLLTGDSMMQSLDAILGDRLSRTATVHSDVHPGTALSTTAGVDWLELAQSQVDRYHPRATVVFLGANDAYPIGGIPCCNPAWSLAYEQRARMVMDTYGQGGSGDVVWIALPIPRDPRRQEAARTVNAAVRRAAASLPRAEVLPADEVFTPGGRYRDTITYEGREVHVREQDGLHLSLAGARIAADYVMAALRRLVPRLQAPPRPLLPWLPPIGRHR